MIKKQFNRTKVIIDHCDPLQEKTDFLVNWTVVRLNGGDDFFHRIHEEGGSVIFKDCQRILASQAKAQTTPELPVGKAAITTAGKLPAQGIIHAVAPNYRVAEQNERRIVLFKETLRNIFMLIRQYNQSSQPVSIVLLTPVSSRIYGENRQREAAEITIQMLVDFAKTSTLRKIKLICLTKEQYKTYSDVFYNQTTTKFDRFLNKWLGI